MPSNICEDCRKERNWNRSVPFLFPQYVGKGLTLCGVCGEVFGEEHTTDAPSLNPLYYNPQGDSITKLDKALNKYYSTRTVQNLDSRLGKVEKVQTKFSKTLSEVKADLFESKQKLDKKYSALEKETIDLSRKVLNPTKEEKEEIFYKPIKDLKNSEKQEKINYLKEHNIYHLHTTKHKLFWIIFFILAPSSIVYWYKLKNKKRKINNSLDEIREKFESWRFSIYSSLLFYIVFFFMSVQFINRFIRPNSDFLINNYLFTTFSCTAVLLGALFVVDGIISSNMKTHLQRLSFNVEKSVSDKILKKNIFFKTQDSNETLKENFKRFGMTVVPTMIIGIFGDKWREHQLSLVSYLIPVIYAFCRILEVEYNIEKIKEII